MTYPRSHLVAAASGMTAASTFFRGHSAVDGGQPLSLTAAVKSIDPDETVK